MPSKNPSVLKSIAGRHRDKAKTALHTLLGGKCKRCGFADSRAIQIDHVHGTENGFPVSRKMRLRPSAILYRLRQGKLQVADFQLLCANCHCIKTYENKDHLNHLKRHGGGIQIPLPLPIQPKIGVWLVCTYCQKKYICKRTKWTTQKFCSVTCCNRKKSLVDKVWERSYVKGRYTQKGDMPTAEYIQ